MRILSLAALAFVPQVLGAYYYIKVGGTNPDGTPKLAFDPPSVQAKPGDIVRFTFNVKNHTVTESSFQEPCAKLKDGYGNLAGFDSGFRPVAANTADWELPTFDVLVNDTKPVWGYCRQVTPPPGKTHCQSGMVFAINAPYEGNTFDKFLSMAKVSTAQNTNSVSSWSSTSASTYAYTAEKTVTVTQTVTDVETVTTTVSQASSSVYWSDAPSTATVPETHTITVGGNPQTTGFRYSPPNITANIGDKVFFQFMVKNHTVTQSSFDKPCNKLANAYGTPTGFDSGFMAVSNTTTSGFPNFTITVNDTNPIWGYCRQQAANFSHCGVGMVFSINANPYTGKSFDAFQLNAVRLNGSGFVDPFGNLTAAPAGSNLYGSGLGSSKDSLNLASTGSGSLSGDDSDSASLSKLLNTYAPATLGLLAAALLLLIAALGVGIALLRRTPSGSPKAMRATPSYAEVPLHVPELGEYSGSGKAGAYDEPRYSDRGMEYRDREGSV